MRNRSLGSTNQSNIGSAIRIERNKIQRTRRSHGTSSVDHARQATNHGSDAQGEKIFLMYELQLKVESATTKIVYAD